MSYEIEALYHRTFESNRFLSTGNIDFTNNRLPADYRYVPPNRAPTMGPPSSGRGSSPPRRNIMEAYYLNNTSLEPIVIWEREDQQLAQYATPWERWWSRLFIHKEAFIPIVNENNTLIGHYGRVLGNRILIKNEDMEGVRYVEDIRDINKVLDLAPLLVGNGALEKAQGGLSHVAPLGP